MIRTYKDIQYTLKRSKRKTASIYVERDGGVSVLVPKELTNAQVEAMLESRRTWIYTNLAEWRDLNAARVPRAYVNGGWLLELGRLFCLTSVQS